MKKIKTGYCGLLMIFCSMLGIFSLWKEGHPPIIGISFLAISAACLVFTIRGLVKDNS